MAQSYGRVVINEYMPWTLNGCGATAEFVELMNFGPGPVNIGCYILTDGDYSVTIPANTILQPGEFYLIAGQDVIVAPCANISRTVYADLNWNACNCTSAPIPTTGDGFFTDGGNGSEQVVLLDPFLNVVDAVVRNLPAEPSATITTYGNSNCASQVFDLDDFSIDYEVLGMSTGRGNSFARRLDGDCGWVKDPQQSGKTTNNTPGETSSVSYGFTIVQSMDCNGSGGSIDVYVNVGSNTEVFPMNYTIAFDSNNDGLFDFTDTYTFGVDNTPPSISIMGLPLGSYRLTVSSSKGCFLKTFNFSILKCTGVLPTQLANFNLSTTINNTHTFQWTIAGVEEIDQIILEESRDGKTFSPAATFNPQGLTGTKQFTQTIAAGARLYRLRLIHKNGKSTLSGIITNQSKAFTALLWPNPAHKELHVQLTGGFNEPVKYTICNSVGSLVAQGHFQANEGTSSFTIPVQKLPPGMYQLFINKGAGTKMESFRFVRN